MDFLFLLLLLRLLLDFVNAETVGRSDRGAWVRRGNSFLLRFRTLPENFSDNSVLPLSSGVVNLPKEHSGGNGLRVQCMNADFLAFIVGAFLLLLLQGGEFRSRVCQLVVIIVRLRCCGVVCLIDGRNWLLLLRILLVEVELNFGLFLLLLLVQPLLLRDIGWFRNTVRVERFIIILQLVVLEDLVELIQRIMTRRLLLNFLRRLGQVLRLLLLGSAFFAFCIICYVLVGGCWWW